MGCDFPHTQFGHGELKDACIGPWYGCENREGLQGLVSFTGYMRCWWMSALPHYPILWTNPVTEHDFKSTVQQCTLLWYFFLRHAKLEHGTLMIDNSSRCNILGASNVAGSNSSQVGFDVKPRPQSLWSGDVGKTKGPPNFVALGFSNILAANCLSLKQLLSLEVHLFLFVESPLMSIGGHIDSWRNDSTGPDFAGVAMNLFWPKWAVLKTPRGWLLYWVILSQILGIITIHYGKSYLPASIQTHDGAQPSIFILFLEKLIPL